MDERYNALAEVHGNIAAANKRLVSENAALQEVGGGFYSNGCATP